MNAESSVEKPLIVEVWLVTAPGYDLRADLSLPAPRAKHPYKGTLAMPRENDALTQVLVAFDAFSFQPAVPTALLQPIERAALLPEALGPKGEGTARLRAALYAALVARDGERAAGREGYSKEIARLQEALSGDRPTAMAVVDSFRDYIPTFYPYFQVKMLRQRGDARDPVAALREVPGILSAYAAPLLVRDAGFVPDDPLYNAAGGGPRWDRSPRPLFPEAWRPQLREQWNLSAIGVAPIWAAGVQGSGVTVAVVDTGVDGEHPDLKGRLHPASDTLLMDQPRRGGGEDPHGTLVAGIIAAESNGRGISGIAPQSQLLSCTWGGPSYTQGAPLVPSASLWVAALIRAVDSGAKVINCSWHAETACDEGDVSFQTEHLLKEAVLYATQRGAVVVSAMGNASRYGLPRPYESWPSALDGQVYKGTGLVVVSVGGVDVHRARFPGSNYGPTMTLVAPGYEVPTTDLSGLRGIHTHSPAGSPPWLVDYAPFGGTSAAAAHVSGVLALMFSVVPDLTPAEARAHLIATAEKIGPLSATHPRDDEYGYGLVQARAVARAAGTRALHTLIGALPAFNSRDAEIFRQVRDDLMIQTRQGQAFAVQLAAVAPELGALLGGRPDVAASVLEDLRALYGAIEVATGRCQDSDSIPLEQEVVVDRLAWRKLVGLRRRLLALGPSPALEQALHDLLGVMQSLIHEKRLAALDALGADPGLRLRRWSPRLPV